MGGARSRCGSEQVEEADVALNAVGDMTAECVFLKGHSGGCAGRGSAGNGETRGRLLGGQGSHGLGGGGWRW